MPPPTVTEILPPSVQVVFLSVAVATTVQGVLPQLTASSFTIRFWKTVSQPRPSVIVKRYVPAAKPVRFFG